MEIAHRNLLRNKRMVLCQAINSQLLIDHLSTSNILTKSDLEILKVKPSNLKKNEKLLDILPKRGPKAFGAFLDALKSNKLSHLLGEGYEEGEETFDNDRILNMNEERPKRDDKYVDSDVNVNADKGTHDIIDAPPGNISHVIDKPMNKQSYDIIDTPIVYPSDGAPKLLTIKTEDIDIASDPSIKQPKVEEPFMYDTVDTPLVRSSLNGFPELTDAQVQSNRGMIINTDTTDFHGQDATDSAPPSAASPECEDGPFSKLGGQRAKEITLPQDIAQSPVEHANCYPMTNMPRGYFLLINNKDFLPESTMEPYPRNGTDIDADAMIALFEELGYIIHAYRNLSCSQMRTAVKKIATMDYNKVSALACCFLSHGKEGVLYGTDGEIEIRDLTSYFRNQRGLVGKPKMFFFQACQGSDYMDGIESDAGRMEVDGPTDHGNDISLPTEADFIYAYSTVPGFYSWRNSARGSWFIQGIVEIFRRYAHKMDVIRMLTRVNEMVSTKKSATGQRVSHHKRQISSIITQLRYELYLFPPHGPLKEYTPASR